jgi:hypothetical protein
MIDGPHLCEIDQTGEMDQTSQRQPVGSARAKERRCQDAAARFMQHKTPQTLAELVQAHDEWAVMVGAPVLELTGCISADDLRDAVASHQPVTPR